MKLQIEMQTQRQVQINVHFWSRYDRWCPVQTRDNTARRTWADEKNRSGEGCINRSILPFGMGARGEHGDVLRFSTEVFSGSLTFVDV